jgi:hypothetical protein
MTIETWKKEFYPVEAEDCPEDQAIEHSLLKWQGLSPDNLAKHGLELSPRFAGIIEIGKEYDDANAKFFIGSDSCALCHHFHSDDPDEDENGDETHCLECPLAITRGAACDHLLVDEEGEELENESPWHEYAKSRDPKPMILWLTKTLENQSN